MAAPAGGAIWLLSNISVSGTSLTGWVSSYLDPLGHAIGLDGVVLLAYIIAIPANEIVRMIVPVRDRRADSSLKIEIQVRANGSLESAGRRVALFARLMDEHDIAALSN